MQDDSQTHLPPAAPTPQNPVQPNNDKLKRNAILWAVSPFIGFVAITIVSFVSAFLGINSRILNMFTLLAGIVSTILLFVGPIVGITKLHRLHEHGPQT